MMFADASVDAIHINTIGIVFLTAVLAAVGWLVVRVITNVDKSITNHINEDSRKFDEQSGLIRTEAEKRATVAGRVSKIEGKLKIHNDEEG